MNNLLRTLTESQAKVSFPDVDLRLLLSTVKEGRRQSQDAKLSDPFYDSLEGLLQDLRTVTPDNRDAEAFLKPVSRADVPDYLDVISNPMDLQSMLKKVKQKQYKSKREFQDDLDLIWTNCFTYNAAENHPLRQCARRLKAKAESLLKNITDRKERTDPFIPPELGHSAGLRIRINGTSSAHIVNGTVNGRSHRSPSISSHNGQVSTSHGSAAVGVVRPRPPFSRTSPASRKGSSTRPDISFAETPALVRTQEGMSSFDTIDKELELVMRSSSSGKKAELLDKLLELAPPYDCCEGIDDESWQPVIKTEPDSVDNLDVEVGEKRKSADHINSRPRKRARFSLSSPLSSSLRQPSTLPLPLSFTGPHSPPHDKDDSLELMELWWGGIQSDALLPNGLPRIRISSSKQSARVAARSIPQSLPPPPPPHVLPSPVLLQLQKPKAGCGDAYMKVVPNHRIEAGPLSLLSMMNANIKTMKRVRHTHARFAALVAATTAIAGADDSIDGAAPGVDNLPAQMAPVPNPSGAAAGSVQGDEEHLDVVDDKADDRPWLQRYIDAAQAQDHVENVSEPVPPGGSSMNINGEPMVKVRRKRKRKRRSRLPTGLDMGEEIADNCVRWMGEKVLEHLGFQGTSRAALDVLAGVTKEYLYNVGRTIKFMSDKYAQTMTPEEIILHTLFESGTSKVQDLEQYITDDVRRHGARLGELEKKLVSAYRDSAANEVQEDEGLFEEEEDDETGALAVGDFADLLGEDYLGLRELGIAAEFGMSTLTIPKKLLRSKKTQKASGSASKPKEPPPPYPLPPPFLPLTYNKLDDQIGLLKPFYQARFVQAWASSPLNQTLTKPTIPPLPGHSRLQSTEPPAQVPETRIPHDFPLPDDTPNLSQVKIGPLGQVMRPSTGSGSGKKKAKNLGSGPAQPRATSGAPPSAGADVPASTENSPKKKKGVTGVGTGNGRKKKTDAGASQAESTQSPVPPPVGFNQSPNRPSQGKGVVFPAVVVASA